MKKIKLNGKLSLNKETIARLNDDEMNGVKGGRFPVASIGKNCSHMGAGKCGPGGNRPITNGIFCNHI